MAYKSYYQPKYPEKYLGDVNNIICRSSWERKYAIFVDNSKDVIKWVSEPFSIKYYYEIDKKFHNYWPDFYVETKNGTKFIIEIKPFKETKPPKNYKNTGNYKANQKKKYRYIRESKLYVKNQNKWKAAEILANKRNMQFKVITERELGI